MPNRSLAIQQVLARLAATPPRLAALTAGLAPARSRSAPDRDGWSANDALADPRARADVWGACLAATFAEDRPTLRAVDPTTRIKQTDDRDLEVRPSLRAFAAQRADLLAVLRTVPSDARRPAGRERPHVTQVGRIVDAVRA